MDDMFDLGLPKKSTAKAFPIGSTMWAPERGNVTFALEDGSVWLQSGVLAASSLYPAAQKLEHLRAHSFTPSTGSTIVGGSAKIATNGTGTYVVADNNSVSVKVSTDYGVTWTTANHNLGIAATDVQYAAGVFVVVGNSATQLKAATSADGLNFSASFVIGAFAAGAASTACLAHSGTLFYAACVSNDATNFAFTSATGLTGSWTNRSGGNAPTSPMGLGAGGGKALIVVTGVNQGNKCTDGGSFTAVTFPGSPTAANPPVFAGGACAVFHTAGLYAYYYSADLTNFSSRTVGNASIGGVTKATTINGRTILGVGNYLVWTSDCFNWNIRLHDNALCVAVAGDPNHLVAINLGTSNASYAVSSLDSSNYVGVRSAYLNSSTLYSQLFVRVK